MVARQAAGLAHMAVEGCMEANAMEHGDRGVVVRVEGLEKTFKDFWGRSRVRAVSGISFTVRRGGVFGLLGPNGSGKSTTLKILLGLLHPSAGSVMVLGASPREVAVKSRIGYLPEESPLYPYLSAWETLDFFGRLFAVASEERRERIGQLLAMVGLSHARDRAVGEFSKGMLRRMGLAQALINNPELVLLDEPTAGLDPVGCRQVKDLILGLAQHGKTVILCSHLLADVEAVCDHIAILHNGRICTSGAMRDLLAEPGSVRITVPALDPGRAADIVAWIRQSTGQDVTWEHPMKALERLFLDVVAQGGTGATPTGVAESAGIADFLVGGRSVENRAAVPQGLARVTGDDAPSASEKPRRTE